MKLPGIDYSTIDMSTKPLGGPTKDQERKKKMGELAETTQVLGNLLLERQKERTEDQVGDALLLRAQDESAFKQEDDTRMWYTGEEARNLGYTGTTSALDAEGLTYDVDVPASKLRGKKYEDYRRDSIDRAAATIEDEDVRNNFIEDEQLKAEQAFGDRYVKEHAAWIEYETDATFARVNILADSGDYDGAREELKNNRDLLGAQSVKDSLSDVDKTEFKNGVAQDVLDKNIAGLERRLDKVTTNEKLYPNEQERSNEAKKVRQEIAALEREEEAEFLGVEANKRVDDIIGRNESYADQVAAVNNLPTGTKKQLKFKEEVKRRLDIKTSTEATVEAQTIREESKNYYDEIVATQNVDLLAGADVDAKTKISSEKYLAIIAKGLPVETVPTVRQKLNAMIQKSPDGFAKENLQHYRHQLSVPEYEAFLGLQSEIMGGAGQQGSSKVKTFRTADGEIKTALAGIGIDPTKLTDTGDTGDRARAFYDTAQDTLVSEASRLGRDLTDFERRDIIKRMEYEEVISKPGMIFGEYWPTTKAWGIDDIPKDDQVHLRTVTEVLRSKGNFRPTGFDIYNEYDILKRGGMLK